MTAFGVQPSILASIRLEEKRAELDVKDLTLRFGGITALNEIDLTIGTGEIVAVIGPNGAGKTSLLNCITGYYRPQEGQIFFNGEDISGHQIHQIARLGIGRTYQDIRLFPGMTVLSNMLLARHIHYGYNLAGASFFSKSVKKKEARQRRVVEELIDFLEIQPFRKKMVSSLPNVVLKRVELGRALALEPKLLLLDEPFAGMAMEEKEEMARYLIELNRDWGQTIILVEHDMSLAIRVSKRIIVLGFGVKLTEGSPDFVQNHPQVIQAYRGDNSIKG
jgi:branched-chain amino acid transport system ATP-binding protein